MAIESLANAVLSDREVLLVLRDLSESDADGWVYAYDVGERLGVVEQHRRRAAAQRLSWLKRYGAVEREHEADEHGNLLYVAGDTHRPRWGQRWRLTPVGEDFATGKLRAAQERALESVTDANLALVAQAVAERARHSSATLANLVEREWKHRWARVNGYPPGY